MAQTINTSNLVSENADYLLAFAMKKISDRELAKDFVQDTFVSAISNIEKFKGDSALRTWLTSILNRKIIDYWRKAETRYTDPISSFFKGENGDGSWVIEKRPQGKMPEFEQEMEKAERHDELSDCIEKLPEKWAGILRAKYFEEEKAEEISKDFDVTTSNLWVIIHRAKLVLRDCLEQKMNH